MVTHPSTNSAEPPLVREEEISVHIQVIGVTQPPDGALIHKLGLTTYVLSYITASHIRVCKNGPRRGWVARDHDNERVGGGVIT